MTEYLYKIYLSRLRNAILLNKPEETQSKLLKYVNSHADKIFPLEYYIHDTKDNYILSDIMKFIKPKDSVYGRCIELYGKYIDKEYKRIYRNTYINKHNEHPINPIEKKEYIFFNRLKEGNINGMCFSCNKITFFCENHHVFGRKNNNFTLSICYECHYKYRGKNHYSNIGRKIENSYT